MPKFDPYAIKFVVRIFKLSSNYFEGVTKVFKLLFLAVAARAGAVVPRGGEGVGIGAVVGDVGPDGHCVGGSDFIL